MDDVCVIQVMDTDLTVVSNHRLSTYDEAIDRLLWSHFSGYVVAVKWQETGHEQGLVDLVQRLDGIVDLRPGQIAQWDAALIVLDPENRRRAHRAQAKQRQLEHYRNELQMAERSLRFRFLGDGAERDV